MILIIATHLDQSNHLANQQQVFRFAVPFASLKSCAKMRCQNHFGGARSACFDNFLIQNLLCNARTVGPLGSIMWPVHTVLCMKYILQTGLKIGLKFGLNGPVTCLHHTVVSTSPFKRNSLILIV
jgi:hypothetical protein